MQKAKALPGFKYHPDPIGSGSIVADSGAVCLVCGVARGYIYTGPVFTEQPVEASGKVCPWCIADGAAWRKWDATFTDAGQCASIGEAVRVEVERRTPGFTGWQQEIWLECCGDAAAFVAVAGAVELETEFAKARPVVKRTIREEYGMSSEEAEEAMEALDKEGDASAYLFRCLHCKKYLAYVDEV